MTAAKILQAVKTVEPFKPDGPSVDELLEFFNASYAVVMLGSKCCVVKESFNPILNREDITFLSVQDFKQFYAHLPLVKFRGKNVPAASCWLQHQKARRYERVGFAPNADENPESTLYNLWKGFAVDPVEGDCTLYLNHLLYVIARGDQQLFKYILAWLADAVQNPTQRPGTSIVMRGDQGTGKSITANIFGSLFGPHALTVHHGKHLTHHFNLHLCSALFVFADEAIWAGDKAGEGVLKALITEPRLTVEPKNKDSFEMPNYVRLMIASNADWVVPAGPMERRFCVVNVSDKHRGDHGYFQAIVDQMNNGGREALLHFLLNHDLTGVNLRSIPQTDALMEQKIQTMPPLDEFWYFALETGAVRPEESVWPDVIPVAELYELFLEYSKKVAPAKRRGGMTSFGMRLRKICPGIERGRMGKNRTPIYRLPSLETCRKYWDKRMQWETDWPEA